MKKKKMTDADIEKVGAIAADLYEKFSDVIPEGTNLLSVIRAAESIIADMVTRVPDETNDDGKIDTIANEIKLMAKLMRLEQ